MKSFKLLFHGVNVFLNVGDKPVRHGFYVNGFSRNQNMKDARLECERLILEKLAGDFDVNFENLLELTVEEIKETSEHLEKACFIQGFVWYGDSPSDA